MDGRAVSGRQRRAMPRRRPGRPGHRLRRTARGRCSSQRRRGRSWVDCELPEPAVFSLAVSAADGAVYAGTEPSRLFRSDDRGGSWRELEALLELPSQPSWSFPPRPWTSHVRWIAPSPHDGDLLLVGIELGGLMRSSDGGQSWQDHRPGAQRDVHSLAWHPQRTGARLRGGRRGRRLQHRRRRDLAARRRGPRPPLHLVGHGRPRRPGVLVRLGEHRPLRGPRPRATRRRTSTGAAMANRGNR